VCMCMLWCADIDVVGVSRSEVWFPLLPMDGHWTSALPARNATSYLTDRGLAV
jgi:hypothetical protein